MAKWYFVACFLEDGKRRVEEAMTPDSGDDEKDGENEDKDEDIVEEQETSSRIDS
jgi:hypothetical protein